MILLSPAGRSVAYLFGFGNYDYFIDPVLEVLYRRLRGIP